MTSSLTLAEVAHVIALATAPAFLLGGVIGFISLVHVQLGRVLERCRALHATGDSDLHAASRASEKSRFERRSRLLIGAIQLAVGAGIATAFLIIIAFVGALAHINVYPVHVITRKSLGDMMRKLSVTESQRSSQFRGTFSRRKLSVASAKWAKVL